MCTVANFSYVKAQTQMLEVGGRKITYRSFGEGRPIIICTRDFEDVGPWNPAFIDALALRGFRVITFDYDGHDVATIGTHGGVTNLVDDMYDLIRALGVKNVVVVGWSFGGIVAQVFITRYPQHATHAVLIATTPPLPKVRPFDYLSYEVIGKSKESCESEVRLLLDSVSNANNDSSEDTWSEATGRLKEPIVRDISDIALKSLDVFAIASDACAIQLLNSLRVTSTPVLHIGGDLDAISPVENWYALNGVLPTLRLITYPQTGHAPHHQHPVESAKYIAAFARETA